MYYSIQYYSVRLTVSVRNSLVTVTVSVVHLFSLLYKGTVSHISAFKQYFVAIFFCSYLLMCFTNFCEDAFN